MIKLLNPFWVFSFFASVFAAFSIWAPTDVSLTSALYASVLAFRLPNPIKPKDLFPLIMLFLFLLVLSQTPTRLFTPSLIYAAQGLVLFRSLLLMLVSIQNEKEAPKTKDIVFTVGLGFDFFVMAFLLYSTFKFVDQVWVMKALLVRASLLFITATFGSRLTLLGVAAFILFFVPQTHSLIVILFTLTVVLNGIYEMRKNGSNLR